MVTEMNVRTERRRIYTPVMLALVMLTVFAGQRAEAIEAGTVIFARGQVSAERDPPVPLAKGDAVLVADAIVTGQAARAQLLMLDGAKVAIRPNSRLLIEEFLYASGEPVPEGTAAASESGDRAVYRLIKGGFRSITGAIGKENEADYEVRTPVGTLGIRGTDYTALLCQDDCEWAKEAGGSPLSNGLHVSVVSGIVVFRNEYGDFELTAGQKFVVPLTDRRPQRVGEPGETDGQDSADGPTDDETPETPITGTDPDGNMRDLTDPTTDPGNRTISWSNGPLPLTLFSGFAGTQDNTPVEYVLDAGNNLDGFVGPHPESGVVVRASFGIGTAANVETGFDPVTMLRWGRWSGGMANITLDTGTDASQDLSLQSLHWISGPEWMTPPVIPLLGAVDYSLIGNTSPTNNFGEIGVLGSATFLADFTNMQVFSTLNLDIGQSSWFASGSGNIGAGAGLPAHQFSGFYNNVTVDGFSTDFGFFSGFFSEPGNTPDPDLPGGAGLTYTLFDDLNQWVSGALVFGSPVAAPPGNRTISWSTAPVGGVGAAFVGTQDNAPGEYLLDGANNLDGFAGPYPTAFLPSPGATPPVRATFGVGTASNSETGLDSVTMLRWGRWSGGTANITLEDGTDASQDLSQQSLHWVSGPEWFGPPVIPLSGAVDYSLIGNTSPTDNSGNVGVLGSASFMADFTNMKVFSDLVLTINQVTWTTSGGVGDIGSGVGLPAHQFSGSYANIAITGRPTGPVTSTNGFFSGFFSDPGNTPDPSLPGGVGMTYTLTDENGGDGGVVVSGALVFGDPVLSAPAQGGGP